MSPHTGNPMGAHLQFNSSGAEIPAEDEICLDTVQLARLERSFRAWVDATSRRDVRLARRRILIVFLLIRFTGAKLSEVLALDPFADISGQTVCIRAGEDDEQCTRTITIGEHLGREIQTALTDPDFRAALSNRLAVDPAFVRRKFYERAEACGFAKRLGGPEMIRRARAVELVRGNMPLPAVQKLLGHSTPNLTAAHVSFSDEELQRVTTLFVERESARKTSARNAFFGKVAEIERGDIQARVTLVTLGGHRVITLITIESLERLGLAPGRLVTAEVKAPWVMLDRSGAQAACSADNRFQTTVARINRGVVSTEYVLDLDDGTQLCAVVSTGSATLLDLTIGEEVWALFSCFAVTLRAD